MQDSNRVNFRYSKDENILYSFIEIDKESKMLSWSFSNLLENLNYSNDITNDYKIPFFVNNVAIFP